MFRSKIVISAYIFLFGFILLNLSCSNTSVQNDSKHDTIPTIDSIIMMNELIPKNDTIIQAQNRDVHIKVVNKNEKKGTFLMLQGWNLGVSEWCDKTDICSQAVKEGYCVVLPQMQKSNYQTQIFAETRSEWRNMPSLYWLTDTLIPLLQKQYGLLLPGERNFIVGLSTGGRGVVMVCMELPGLFTGAAALSGDYDQSRMPQDKVHIGFYGPYQENTERWKTVDNPLYRIDEFSTPLYLGHGIHDNVTNCQQSILYYDSLKKHHPKLRVELHTPEAGHNYDYWASEVENIMAFFKSIR